MKAFRTLVLGATLAAAASPALAAVGLATGQHARVMDSIARTQQSNNAVIAHVRRSIAATRRNRF